MAALHTLASKKAKKYHRIFAWKFPRSPTVLDCETTGNRLETGSPSIRPLVFSMFKALASSHKSQGKVVHSNGGGLAKDVGRPVVPST